MYKEIINQLSPWHKGTFPHYDYYKSYHNVIVVTLLNSIYLNRYQILFENELKQLNKVFYEHYPHTSILALNEAQKLAESFLSNLDTYLIFQ